MDSANIVHQFNVFFPVGSAVQWRSVSADKVKHQTYIVREPAFDSYGKPVAFLEGVSGFVSVEPEFVLYPPDAKVESVRPSAVISKKKARAKQRYDWWLDSDSIYEFGEWLKLQVYKEYEC